MFDCSGCDAIVDSSGSVLTNFTRSGILQCTINSVNEAAICSVTEVDTTTSTYDITITELSLFDTPITITAGAEQLSEVSAKPTGTETDTKTRTVVSTATLATSTSDNGDDGSAAQSLARPVGVVGAVLLAAVAMLW